MVTFDLGAVTLYYHNYNENRISWGGYCPAYLGSPFYVSDWPTNGSVKHWDVAREYSFNIGSYPFLTTAPSIIDNQPIRQGCCYRSEYSNFNYNFRPSTSFQDIFNRRLRPTFARTINYGPTSCSSGQ